MEGPDGAGRSLLHVSDRTLLDTGENVQRQEAKGEINILISGASRFKTQLTDKGQSDDYKFMETCDFFCS